MNLRHISDRLQNPKNTIEQLDAFGALRALKVEIDSLYNKYRNLGRDWTKETKSDK